MKERTIFQTTAKTPLKFIFFGLAITSILAMFIVATAYGSPVYAIEDIEYGYFGFLIAAAVFAGLGFLFLGKEFTLTVTDVRVSIVSKSGKAKAELPVNKITAVGCGLFKRVSAATSGGKITLFFVRDKAGAYKALSDIISNNCAAAPLSASAPSDDELPDL